MKHLNRIAANALKCSKRATCGALFISAFVYTDLAFAQVEPFSKIFEAEKAVTSGALVKNEQAGYTCTGYVAFQNIKNDYLEWQVVVPAGGEYTAAFRYAFGGEGAGPLKVEVNGAISGNLYPFFSTGSWSNWQINNLGVVLKAGVNYIRLTSNGYATPLIDHVKIVKNGTPAEVQPTSNCREPFSQYFEAESANRSGAIVATLYSGYSYTGYVDFQNPADDYIEWTFNIPSSGWYEYEFRYANGAGTRPLRIDVNGNTIASYYPITSTGAWSNWEVTSLGAYFAQGINTVRLTSIGFNGPNIDWLSVYQSSATASAAKKGEKLPSPFPNPAVDVLNVKLNKDFDKAEIHLFSHEGVEQRVNVIKTDAEGTALDVSGVKPGVYSLKVQRGKAIEMKQIRIK